MGLEAAFAIGAAMSLESQGLSDNGRELSICLASRVREGPPAIWQEQTLIKKYLGQIYHD